MRAAEGLESLAADDRNQEGGWSFVSIDKYYDTAARALRREGLTWSVTATNLQQIGPVWVWTLLFTLRADDGQEQFVSVIPVTHEYDGPQTTGKAFSYGEKIFMRTLLKAVTGEPDADSSPARSGKPKRPRQGPVQEIAAQPPEGPERAPPSLAEQLVAFKASLAAAQDEQGIHAAVKKHRDFIRDSHRQDPDIFEQARKARWAREDELEIPRDQ